MSVQDHNTFDSLTAKIESLENEKLKLKAMIKKAVQSIVFDPNDLSKVIAMGMAVDERIPESTRKIAEEQILGGKLWPEA